MSREKKWLTRVLLIGSPFKRRDHVDVAMIERQALDQPLAPEHLVELERHHHMRLAQPARQLLGPLVQGQDRDRPPAHLQPALARLRLGTRIEKRLHLVAQMVVARVVGGRDLVRVRAHAHDHRRLQPVAELERHLLDQEPRQRHRRHHQRPAAEHPQPREIDLEQVEQRQVEQQRARRHHRDVAQLLPELAPPAVMAEMLEHHQAAGDQQRQDRRALLGHVLKREVQQPAGDKAADHRRHVRHRQRQQRAHRPTPRSQPPPEAPPTPSPSPRPTPSTIGPTPRNKARHRTAMLDWRLTCCDHRHSLLRATIHAGLRSSIVAYANSSIDFQPAGMRRCSMVSAPQERLTRRLMRCCNR